MCLLLRNRNLVVGLLTMRVSAILNAPACEIKLLHKLTLCKGQDGALLQNCTMPESWMEQP